MREILFRGKSPDNGEWVEGYLIQKGGETLIARSPYCTGKLHETSWLEFCFGGFIEVIPETVGQYTGLTDKNGKKIFEGDIVRYNDTIHKVIFCTINGSAFFGITMPDRGEIWNFDGITCANKMEVIGNIHDTPELFKEREGQ